MPVAAHTVTVPAADSRRCGGLGSLADFKVTGSQVQFGLTELRPWGRWGLFLLCLYFMRIRHLGLFLIDLLGDLLPQRDAFLPGKPLLWLCRHN